MNTRFLSILLAVAVVGTSCSFDISIGGQDPAEAAVEIIETELAEVIGLGPIDAVCESPESVDVGTTWGCTGEVDGETIDFLVEIDREDHINVETVNLIGAPQVEGVAQESASIVNEALSASLPADAFDCGDSSIVLPPSNEFTCLVESGTETIETTITITNLDDTSFEVDLDPFEALVSGGALEATAAQIIEGELADLIGLGPMIANCQQPPSTEVGATWTCTADVDGRMVLFAAVVDREDHVNVNTINVILADQVPPIAVEATRQLNQAAGAELPDDAMDCGNTAIILSANADCVCALDTGSEIYDATIEITDPSTTTFTVSVAGSPRE